MDKDIINFMEENSYFNLILNEDRMLEFTTRKHGSNLDETFGKEDYEEAVRLKTLINEKFPNIKVEVDTWDEWVSLLIKY